jgi:PAS domain S-box-containing protein
LPPSTFHLAPVAEERSLAASPADAAELSTLLLDGLGEYGLLVLDAGGRVRTWGRGAERVYGWGAAEIVGGHYGRLFLPHDEAEGKPVAALESALQHGRHEEESLRLRKDGSTFWGSAVLLPLRAPDGAVRGWAEVARDVSARRQAEASLHRLSDARSAVRARDEFLALAAHELKTPLTALALNLQALVRAARKKPDDVLATLDTRTGKLLRHVDRMTGLVEALLDVARLASGNLELDLGDADLEAVLARAAERCRAEHGAACAGVEVCSSGPVPARVDARRVEGVLLKLLDNAVKYGGSLPVHLSLSAEGGRARIAVRDHGLGIAAEAQERIFERFERAAPAKQYGGFGFGLWAAREIVAAHGGEIQVTSAPGEGSTFMVELPLAGPGRRRGA